MTSAPKLYDDATVRRIHAAIAAQQVVCRHEFILRDGRCWWCGANTRGSLRKGSGWVGTRR